MSIDTKSIVYSTSIQGLFVVPRAVLPAHQHSQRKRADFTARCCASVVTTSPVSCPQLRRHIFLWVVLRVRQNHQRVHSGCCMRIINKISRSTGARLPRGNDKTVRESKTRKFTRSFAFNTSTCAFFPRERSSTAQKNSTKTAKTLVSNLVLLGREYILALLCIRALVQCFSWKSSSGQERTLIAQQVFWIFLQKILL